MCNIVYDFMIRHSCAKFHDIVNSDLNVYQNNLNSYLKSGGTRCETCNVKDCNITEQVSVLGSFPCKMADCLQTKD